MVVFQAMDWIKEVGEAYLSTHKHTPGHKEEAERLLDEHSEFLLAAKVSPDNQPVIVYTKHSNFLTLRVFHKNKDIYGTRFSLFEPDCLVV